jgi:hypothetical protein
MMEKLEMLLKDCKHEIQVEKGWQIIRLKVNHNKRKKIEEMLDDLNNELLTVKKYVILL